MIHTLDLNFQGIPGAIASYLIPHSEGVLLIESGPGSTIPALQAGLRKHGYTEKDVSAVLLTHIHLDHAGAAGWLARQGAQIYVHPVGAPHLISPEKLLASAARLYGDQMEALWGEFLPTPRERLTVVEDNQVIEIGGVRIRALDTPGHANHHHVYIYDEICFTGDVAGVRMAGTGFIGVPMVPPEFILEKWRESLLRLQQEYQQGSFVRLAPTHFGEFRDTAWHLARLQKALDEIEAWMQAVMADQPDDAQLSREFLAWTDRQMQVEGLTPIQIQAYGLANPPAVSVPGIRRYWVKHRMPVQG
ncbi:MAG: MBL fold metallo-hydrolase [Anaerolineales bacterium]|jgi:glyoxylase-like metal-dependent hydrolase (beta-lactamase superfamily II)|nr:MBL fold metallo-hydrolase [Anaerolineales bacterium]